MQDALYESGIHTRLLDIVFGHYFIYTLLSDGILTPVFLYENCISYKQSQAYGLPKLHFCMCDEIQNNFNLVNRAQTLSNRHYIAKIAKKNAFNVSIKQGMSEVAFYNDYPLELCPMCKYILQQMREGEVINSTLSVYVFSHQWLELLESNASIRQKELIALQNANLLCYKCKSFIDIDSSVWIHINKVLKICCC